MYRSTDSIKVLIITAIAIAAYSRVDSLYSEVTFAPLVSLMTLFAFALKFRPKDVFVASLFFGGFVCAAIFSLPSFDPASEVSWVRLAIRTITFFVGGMLATATSWFRIQNRELLEQAMTLVHRLPTPILISDINETLVSVNERAGTLFGEDPSFLKGRSLRSLLEYVDPKALDLGENSTQDIVVAVRGVQQRARICWLGFTRRKLLVVVFLQ